VSKKKYEDFASLGNQVPKCK